MVFVLVLFFALIYQLDLKLYKPLMKFMDDRDANIAKNLKAAGSLSDDGEEMLSRAKANIDEAKAKAASMRQEAIEELKASNAEAFEKRQRELEEEYEKFLAGLEEEREALKGTVLSQLPLIKESLKAKFNQI
jgi:F-type H+-transporting ATPase subunit b